MVLRQKRILGISLGILTALFYGMYPSGAQAVYADGGNVVFMIIASTWMRMLFLLMVCVINRKAIFVTSADRRIALWGGALQILSVIGNFAAILYIPAPVAISIVYLHTLMQMLYMAWKKEIDLSFMIVTTTLAALLGVGLVLDVWHPQNINWMGVSLALLSAVTAAARMYIYGRQTKGRNPAVVGVESFISASFLALLILLFKPIELPHSLPGYGWAAMSSLSIALGTLTMFYGIALLGAFSLSMIIKLEPIFTALFSIIVIGEILGWHQYLGILVVIGSLIAFQYYEHKNKMALEKQ
jgi:drug/metabolite transporter (DMT)-like permease